MGFQKVPINVSPGVHTVTTESATAPHVVDIIDEGPSGQSPSARAAHRRGHNASVAPAPPATPTPPAGAPQATSGATIKCSPVLKPPLPHLRLKLLQQSVARQPQQQRGAPTVCFRSIDSQTANNRVFSRVAVAPIQSPPVVLHLPEVSKCIKCPSLLHHPPLLSPGLPSRWV